MTFNQIADYLNKKIILSERGKDEKLKEKYPEVGSDFYLDIYDKSILSRI